ncbi:putative maltose permease [Xylogone sp. PMI_703]|nr:putative maltose permease [Xylogone sp. PMI_703]
MDMEKDATVPIHQEEAPLQVINQLNNEDHQMPKWEAVERNPQAFWWSIYAVWTILLVSFDNQASGIVFGIPQFRKDFGYYFNGNYVLDAKWQSAFSGTPLASNLISSLTAGQVSDKIGRRYTIVIVLLISFAAVTLEVVAVTNEVFFAGKFLNRFATGTLASVCVTYIGEISPLALYGLLTCMSALSYTVSPFISLRCLGYRGEDDSRHLSLIKIILEEIYWKTESVSYLEYFRSSNLRQTIISVTLLLIQSLADVVFVAFYIIYYIQLTGFNDKIGYADLRIINSIKATVTLLFLYCWFYNLIISATVFILLYEVSTSCLRVKIIAINISLQNCLNLMWSFVILYLFNPDRANLGTKIAFIFGGLAVFCVIYLWFYQPETSFRSYEELDEMFMKKVPAQEFKGYITDTERRGESPKDMAM